MDTTCQAHPISIYICPGAGKSSHFCSSQLSPPSSVPASLGRTSCYNLPSLHGVLDVVISIRQFRIMSPVERVSLLTIVGSKRHLPEHLRLVYAAASLYQGIAGLQPGQDIIFMTVKGELLRFEFLPRAVQDPVVKSDNILRSTNDVPVNSSICAGRSRGSIQLWFLLQFSQDAGEPCESLGSTGLGCLDRIVLVVKLQILSSGLSAMHNSSSGTS